MSFVIKFGWFVTQGRISGREESKGRNRRKLRMPEQVLKKESPNPERSDCIFPYSLGCGTPAFILTFVSLLCVIKVLVHLLCKNAFSCYLE